MWTTCKLLVAYLLPLPEPLKLGLDIEHASAANHSIGLHLSLITLTYFLRSNEAILDFSVHLSFYI